MIVDIHANLTAYDGLGRPFGVKGLKAMMDKYRIGTAVLVSSCAIFSDFRAGNKEILEAVKADDRLFGYLAVNPNYVDESMQMIRQVMYSPKLAGIAVFHGSSRDYPNVDDCRGILNSYRRFGKPVFLHTPHAKAVAAAEEMAQEFHNTKFILGSMGGEEWRRALACGKFLNIVLETSGSFDAEKVEEAVEYLGPHRVLFGSNMPYSDPASMMMLVRSSSIQQDSMFKVLGGNARSVLMLGQPGKEPKGE